MIDQLGNRFAALADPVDDGDWVEVRRRARRRLRAALLPPAAAAIAAAAVAATALAATGHWRFWAEPGAIVTLDPKTGAVTHRWRDIHVVTTVAYHGSEWRVRLELAGTGIRTELVKPNGDLAAASTGMPIVGAPPSRNIGRRRFVGYLAYSEGSGAIVFGAAAPGVTRVRVFAGSQSWSTGTVAARPGFGVRLRFWALVVPRSVTKIEALGAHGRVVDRLAPATRRR